MKKRYLLTFIPALLLLGVIWFLFFRNYTPNTYLIGWDSLHPEFNFPLAFQRLVSGVWRAEQGVGAIAAHGDVADFPRVILLYLSSFVLPASFLRYFYIFICLFLGPLGVYFFLKYVFQIKSSSLWVYPSAFLGGLFYLLNLGTLQTFYVPLEMFTTAFAFLPWLFFSGLKYLREGKKSNLIFWIVVVILSSPMAYAATLWYASFAGLFIFLGAFKSKRFLVLAASALVLNLYWILPNIYSIVNQSNVISNSNINRLFSPEAFLRNADYGDFKDILLQKNFLFGWRNFDFTGNKFVDLLGEWTKYLSNPVVSGVGYILAGISSLGLLWGVIKREKAVLAFIPPLLFTLFFLLNINPPLGGLYAYLYNHFGIFAEGFRMPFTKFSVLYEFIVSFYFGYFAFLLLTYKTRSLMSVIVFVKVAFLLLITAGLIYFMLPAFNGQLIGSNVRKVLPSQYQQMFDWFNSNPEGRVALFPINSKYGWEYRNWGYEGSGFITFGISDPILYRDFDRWSSANEDFYNQASTALYDGDTEGFIDTLKKYQVKYLLMDASIVNPGGSSDFPKIPEFKQVASFGFLTIYETDYGADVSAPSGDYISPGNIAPVRLTPAVPIGIPVISEDLSINRGFAEAYNCDLEKTGKVFKTNLSPGILYRAEDGGVSCDYLSYPDLKYNQAYVLRIAGENKEGRSLKIYLTNNETERADLEELLPEGDFDETYFVYPSLLEGAGYTLNLETRSFGRIASENLLTKVEFYPVDSGYLTNFIGLSSKAVYSIQNGLKIINVKKYGTWGYKVEIQGSGLIQLGQGFEKGWIALQFPISNFQFSILKHVKVDSWANGWIVPNCQNENSLKILNCKLLIVYWPQLLEWGGMAAGAAAFLVLTLLKFRLY